MASRIADADDIRRFLVKSAPAYVYAHVFHRFPRHGQQIVRELTELGHSFSVETQWTDVALADW